MLINIIYALLRKFLINTQCLSHNCCIYCSSKMTYLLCFLRKANQYSWCSVFVFPSIENLKIKRKKKPPPLFVLLSFQRTNYHQRSKLCFTYLTKPLNIIAQQWRSVSLTKTTMSHIFTTSNRGDSIQKHILSS